MACCFSGKDNTGSRDYGCGEGHFGMRIDGIGLFSIFDFVILDFTILRFDL